MEGQETGLGSHTFHAVPHVGEYISMNDSEGNGQAYKVKAVIHVPDPSSSGGDLIIEHVGTEMQLMQRLLPVAG